MTGPLIALVLLAGVVAAALWERRQARRRELEALLAEMRDSMRRSAAMIGEQLVPAFQALVDASKPVVAAFVQLGEALTRRPSEESDVPPV